MVLFSILPSEISQFLHDYWLLVAISLVPAIYWYSTRNFDYWKKRGIKGPPATPFIGNFFSFRIPFPLLQMGYLKNYGKIYGYAVWPLYFDMKLSLNLYLGIQNIRLTNTSTEHSRARVDQTHFGAGFQYVSKSRSTFGEA